MASIVDIKSLDDFEALAKESNKVAIHFWASWCEPCKQMDIVFATLAKENPGVTFARVEAEEIPDVSEKCGVSAVPFFALLSGPKVVASVEGADPLALITALGQHFKKTPAAPTAAAQESKKQLFARIQKLIDANDVTLFMKGTADEPKCGFSGKVVRALDETGVSFGTFDILTDEAVRTGIKEMQNWPTFPQLYCKGELVGGCDIVLEMAASGELKDLFKEKGLLD